MCFKQWTLFTVTVNNVQQWLYKKKKNLFGEWRGDTRNKKKKPCFWLASKHENHKRINMKRFVGIGRYLRGWGNAPPWPSGPLLNQPLSTQPINSRAGKFHSRNSPGPLTEARRARLTRLTVMFTKCMRGRLPRLGTSLLSCHWHSGAPPHWHV